MLNYNIALLKNGSHLYSFDVEAVDLRAALDAAKPILYHDPYDGCRYTFDEVLTPRNGWTQYDTTQDASYFGVWVNVERRLTFTYAEGDMYFVVCPTLETFRAELADMQRCYGNAPPCAIGIDNDGTRTEFYDERARPQV